MFKYLRFNWSVTQVPDGFVLVIVDPLPEYEGRTLHVGATGVHECSRDGLVTKLMLIDCGGDALGKVLKHVAGV